MLLLYPSLTWPIIRFFRGPPKGGPFNFRRPLCGCHFIRGTSINFFKEFQDPLVAYGNGISGEVGRILAHFKSEHLQPLFGDP
jgi:hypothetical protein